MQILPGTSSEKAAEDPIKVIEHGDQKCGPVLVKPLLVLDRAENGIGLVGQRQNYIGAAPPHTPELFNKAYTIKDVACVDEKCHQGKGGKGRSGDHHRHHDNLHGTGEDKQSGGGGEQNAVPRIAHQHAKRNANEEIGKENRARIPDSKPQLLHHFCPPVDTSPNLL